MRVIVSNQTVAAVAGTAEAWKLHKLLSYACQGRHVLSFDTAEALDAWFETLDNGSRTAYTNAIAFSMRLALRLPTNVATLLVDPDLPPGWNHPRAVLGLNDALDLLDEPLGILLENSDNDWHFLCGIMRRSERELVMRQIERNWAVTLHGGGSELMTQLQKRLDIGAKALRTFALFDSDRLHPDEFLAGWSPERPGKQPAACQAFEWEKVVAAHMPGRYWRLRRRFIESYMPKEELSSGASNEIYPETIDAFFRMSQGARWYFNMKHGFEGDNKRDDKERCRDLFDGFDAADRAMLSKGFGRKLADHYANAVNQEFNWDTEARSEAATALADLMCLL